MPAVNPDQFRNALGKYATGVTVVTTRDAGGNPAGMTVNSFTSVSLDPPLVLWSVDKHSPLFPAFFEAGWYAVHVLDCNQQYLARHFSDDREDVFDGIRTTPGLSGLPLLENIAVSLQCEVVNRHDEGDHVILVGHVVRIESRDVNPLLYFGGEYRRLKR